MPGAGATEFPGGTGKLLEAGSRIIIQIHYNVAQAKDTEPDASRVELSLADPTAKLKPVHDVPLAAPVEILCPGPYPSSPNDPCNREYALERSELRVVSNGIHLLCGTRPKDFTSRDVGDGSSQENSCDLQVQEDGIALGVAGHMHLRGRSIEISLNSATLEARTLLHIPDWDFDWQGQYWFQEPIPLRAGETLRVTCIYDNSGPIPGPDGNPIQPRCMTLGEGTTDEMCLGAVSFIEASNSSDSSTRIPGTAVGPSARKITIKLSQAPGDFLTHSSLSHRPVGELSNTGVGAMRLNRGWPVRLHRPLVGPQKGRLPLLGPWGLGPAPRRLATAP